MRNEAFASAPELQAVLGQLRAFAGARIAGDDQDLVMPQRLEDLGAAGGNRQVGIVFEHQRRRDARIPGRRLIRHV
jgi:hypothetical protein